MFIHQCKYLYFTVSLKSFNITVTVSNKLILIVGRNHLPRRVYFRLLKTRSLDNAIRRVLIGLAIMVYEPLLWLNRKSLVHLHSVSFFFFFYKIKLAL